MRVGLVDEEVTGVIGWGAGGYRLTLDHVSVAVGNQATVLERVLLLPLLLLHRLIDRSPC